MSVLYRFWLRLSLCWQRGQNAEARRLRLLNDALHREGKLRGAGVTTLPRWRAVAMRGESTQAANTQACTPCQDAPCSPILPEKDVNHVLFLSVPDSMFRRRNK